MPARKPARKHDLARLEGRNFNPGNKCPVSGQYAIVDPTGLKTEYEITLSKGERFPPQRNAPGSGYRLLDATRHRRARRKT